METVISVVFLIAVVACAFAYRPYSRFVAQKYGYDAEGWTVVLSFVLLVLLIAGTVQEAFWLVNIALSGFIGLLVYRCYWIGVPHAVGLTLCQLLSALLIALVKFCGVIWGAMTGYAFGTGGAKGFTQKQNAHRERQAAIRRKYEAEAAALPEDDGYHGSELAGMEAELEREMQAELSEERARYANEQQ